MPLRPRQQGSAAYGHRLVLDSLDLPVLEIDRHPPPEESNGGHEAVPAAAPDDRADEPPQGTDQGPDRVPHDVGRLGSNRQARGEHLMDLAQILLQGRLIRNECDPWLSIARSVVSGCDPPRLRSMT